jgi:phage-related protein
LRNRSSNYRVLPLPIVQRWATKELSRTQLRGAIELARRLRFYPEIPDLDTKPCGAGLELYVEHPSIGKQGWLRAIFWVHEKSKTIYVVDLFWKKSNAISTADKLRADHRIGKLRLKLAAGKPPWR